MLSNDGELPDEDLSEEVYYSDGESDIMPTDVATDDAVPVEEVPNPRPADVAQDHAAVLTQLLGGGFPSPATIELAIKQLTDALTAEEKQLVVQLAQQMVIMNPVLVTASPLALQVEAIRIVLTTRGQRAVGLGAAAVQQMALQAQPQNLPQTGVSSLGATATAAATQPTGAPAQSESYLAAAAVNHHQEDIPSQSQVSRPSHHHFSGETTQQVPVSEYDDLFERVEETDPNYPDESSSVSGDGAHPRAEYRPVGASSSLSGGRVQLRAGFRSADADTEYPNTTSSVVGDYPRLGAGRGAGRGHGSGTHLRGDEMCGPDRPRGRGMWRGKKTGGNKEVQPDNSTASLHQPLVPPPLHTAQPVRRRNDRQSNDPEGKSSESWEEEVDNYGSRRFCVASSFFKTGK